METVLKAIADWIKGILTAGIMSNLSGLFDDVNTQVGNIAQQVGTKPSSFEPRVFAMIEALSRNVVLPIAGIILTFIACYELIEMITQHNNMAQFEPALLMKWIFKTAISVWMIADLPILPQKWQYLVSTSTKKQFGILQKLMHRPDVESVICATDAGQCGWVT